MSGSLTLAQGRKIMIQFKKTRKMQRAFLKKGAFAAAVLIVAAGCGCGREESPAAAPSAAQANAAPKVGSQADPAFRARLDAQVAERTRLTAVRGRLVRQMEAMVAAERAARPGADDAAVKAALEEKPEWKSLYARVADVNAALEDNRQQSTSIVRRQLTGK